MHSGSLAFVLPFLNVYLVSHGLSPAQVGVLAALRPVVGTPAAAGWAAAADASAAHRAVLGFCFLASTVGRLVVGNWIRTVGWTARGVVVAAMVVLAGR